MRFALRILFVILTIAAWSSWPCLAADTVFFVVRHAEKVSNDDDTPLTAAGKERAQHLMETLKHLRVDAAYHSQFPRTKETAEPTIEKLKAVAHQFMVEDATWVGKAVSDQQGKRVLIVGHSGQVEEVVKELTGKTVAPIGNEFDNLFIVVISGDDKSVVRLKYGAASP